MKIAVASAALAILAVAGTPSHSTGLTTCNSGPESSWKSQDSLKQQLTNQGWQIRRIKVDGGCYEVYALDNKGARVEAYFHPVTFENVTPR